LWQDGFAIAPRAGWRFHPPESVEHEIQHWNASTLTKSSGARGISQSVFPRTESSHALSFFIRWRAVPLRHQGLRRRFFTAAPFAGRASSQPNNSRAWGTDNFLTLLTASSTALMQFTLASKLVGGKPICLRPVRGFSQPVA
jgi:hypothetical protein